MAQLSSHILDLASGRPASGVRVRLHKIEGDARKPLADTRTDDDGRCKLTSADRALASGSYELNFFVGSYFAEQGAVEEGSAFLDVVPVCFRVQAGQRYHVPLLISPYGYSTYRGS